MFANVFCYLSFVISLYFMISLKGNKSKGASPLKATALLLPVFCLIIIVIWMF